MTPEGMKLLHKFEACKLKAYLCPADVWTIGWGNTRYEDGAPVEEGDEITQERADELSKNITERFERSIKTMVDNPDWRTAHRMSALTILVYNIGPEAFRKSTVLKRINQGDTNDRIAEAWSWWNKAGGEVSNGLVKRRKKEIDFAFSKE